jgi:hypothetical protein
MLLSVSVSIAAITGANTAASAEVVSHATTITDETSTTGPNRALLRSGVWTLGAAYAPALIVAVESNRTADKRLYIPVAGPWLDLSSRGKCAATEKCDHETTNKVLLAVDGVFQGIGALNIIGSFLFPETRSVTVASNGHKGASGFSIRVVPTRVEGAYGVAAVGKF